MRKALSLLLRHRRITREAEDILVYQKEQFTQLLVDYVLRGDLSSAQVVALRLRRTDVDLVTIRDLQKRR